MTDCIREELVNGKDECFNKVVQYLDEKSNEYYRRLCEVFGSTEYFEHFKQCYQNSISPCVDDQALSPLHEHLCAILEWRSLLATEVEALQSMKTEIEDYPKDFEIQIRLSESLHEQNRLRRELETLKEQAERLQMENNAYNAIIDEVKKDCSEKVAESNERAKKAEKAFIDLTRHRSVNQTSEYSAMVSKPPDAALQKRTSETMLNAMSPFSFKTSMDKVQSSSSRFKAYSTLTWEGFDSLDEDSDEEEEKGTSVIKPIKIPDEPEPRVVELPPSKTTMQEVSVPISEAPHRIDERPKTPVEEKRPSTPESFVTELPKLDASPIKPRRSEDTVDETDRNIRTSLSSTPRKSLPVTPHQAEDISTPEPSIASASRPNCSNSPVVASSHIKSRNSVAEVRADSVDSDVVDKSVYLQLYDKYLDLQSELEKVNIRQEQSLVSNTDALSSGVVPGNELGLTTQLNDLRDQVCDTEGQEPNLASPTRISGGDIFSTIPNTPKHFTDWSISLDQTNASNAAMDTSDNDIDRSEDTVDETDRNIRTSLSSTPRKSLPVTPHQAEDISTPEPSIASASRPNCSNSPVVASSHIKSRNSVAEVRADSVDSDVVDKSVYLQLYDKYLDLQSELEKVNIRQEQSLVSNTDALSSGVVPGNELGLTTQLNDLRDQVCDTEGQEPNLASPTRISGGDIFSTIPNTPKHFTDWSISLDQTNASNAAMDTSDNDIDSAVKVPRPSLSVGQQTDLSLLCANCSSDSVNTHSGLVPLQEVSPSALGVHMLSPASTLQELNVDFSESTARQGSGLEVVESACSPIPDLTPKGKDVSTECHLTTEALREENRDLSESITGAADICVDILRRLSTLQSKVPLPSSDDDTLKNDAVDLRTTLQKLGTEVERLSRSYVELEAKQASQPSYMAEITKLREKLEEAERLIEAKSPILDSQLSMLMNEVLEAEREQLQRELNQRLADCGTTHATSVAELEKVQADLSARLNASEIRACNLESERNAIVQKLNATERFLNEQLQERELEREEYQTEVSALQEEITSLRNKLTVLQRQRSLESVSTSSLAHTPLASPIKPHKSKSRQSGIRATSTPVTNSSQGQVRPQTLTTSFLSVPDASDQSDVDDSPSFELAPTPQGMESQANTLPRDWSIAVVGNSRNRNPITMTTTPSAHFSRRTPRSDMLLESSWSEDSDYHSPGDCENYYKCLMAANQLEGLEEELHKIAVLRMEITRSEMNLCGSRPLSAGDALLRQQIQPPVKMITTSVECCPVELVDVSISAQNSLSHRSSSSSSESDEDIDTTEELEDVETVTTTAAAMGLVTTVTTTKKKRKNARHNPVKSVSHTITSPEVPPNNLGLDVEMRHVAELQELREALITAQNLLAEKEMELEDMRAQLEPQVKPPQDSVEVQTSTNAPVDSGTCWLCKSQLPPLNNNSMVTIAAASTTQTQQISIPIQTQGRSRNSTLSPPSLTERQSDTTSVSNADGSVSSEFEDGEEEEEMYQQMEHVSSSESDHLAADLEEAKAENEALKAEINGLINYQDDLHRDFELVQSMLEERQSEVERLQKELLDMPIRLQDEFDASMRKLQKRMSEKCNVVEERDEDLYVLNEEKEALAERVKELEIELVSLRENLEAGVNREDTASQTDPPHCTVESGIQVDLEPSNSSPKVAEHSYADTDCASEDDLPFDGDFIIHTTQTNKQFAVPQTTEETLAVVDQLQQESCRLLSLSLTAAATEDPNDYKSQLISRLIEANRILKSVIENVTKDQDISTAEESALNTPRSKSLPNSLYSSLLSALLADRKATFSLLTLNIIDQASNVAFTRSSKGGKINDVMKALAAYAAMEEERWKEVSMALTSDRKGLLSDVDSMKKRQVSLLEEVARLSNQLSARDTVVAEKSAAVNKMSEEIQALEVTISDLQIKVEEAKKDKENIIAMTRSQIEEERQRIAELESTLESSQNALYGARERIVALESDVQKSSADLRLEQNRSQLADTRITQLEQEVKALKSSYVRVGPKASVNSSVADLKRNSSSTISHLSGHLASVRLRAIQAEKMSRDLHTCNQDLRVSLAEAELALLPLSLGKENGHYLVNGEGSGSGSSSGDDDSTPYSGVEPMAASRTFPKQLTDSGFADAPAGLRRLHLTCMRLLHLVTLATGGSTHGDAGSSSSSSDSLNNPAELLRYAVLGGKKADYTEVHTGPAEVYGCLAEIESHVRAMVGGGVACGSALKSNSAVTALLTQAKQLIINGVAQLESSMAQIAGSVDAPDSISQVLTDSKSTQCSLVTNHQSSGDSRTVSLEKFRHMSARYLRMESYRRALVYQKQYLLLLLGDFQHSVQRVTSSLGQGLLMGTTSRQDADGNPLSTPPHWPLESPPSLVRFRAAARCIMVIHRVKQLRLKWLRTGIRGHAPVYLTSENRTPTTMGQSNAITSLASASVNVPAPIPTFGKSPQLISRHSNLSLASQNRISDERGASSLTPSTRIQDLNLGMSQRRNNSTPSVKQIPRGPSFPRMDTHQYHQVEVSGSFQQQQHQTPPSLHHRVPTSSTSLPDNGTGVAASRYRWGSFRG
nr:hypothetical transcript [Hymenolepis microstoma]